MLYAGRRCPNADSRYATRDPFTISMEAVTAFVEGPLCFAVLYGMVKRSPWRYTVQFAVSLGQLYGDVLYFATAVLEGLFPNWHHGTVVWLDGVSPDYWFQT